MDCTVQCVREPSPALATPENTVAPEKANADKWSALMLQVD
jgi:hypothetical protein